MAPEPERVLLVGMPLRHLIEAAQICASRGAVVLPAGGAGDLSSAAPGTEVLFITSEAGEREVPAATFRAELIGTVPAGPDAFPDGLPTGWVEERQVASSPAAVVPRSPFGDLEDDESGSTNAKQCYFEVRSLTELPKAAWIFVNELVPKQERRGRSYFPRTPRRVERPS